MEKDQQLFQQKPHAIATKNSPVYNIGKARKHHRKIRGNTQPIAKRCNIRRVLSQQNLYGFVIF